MIAPSVVITGASSGLGWQIALALYQKGWTVYGLSDNPPPSHYAVNHIPCNVRSYQSVFRTAQHLKDKPIQVLINCAAVNRINYLEDIKPEEWDAVVDTNAKGIFHTAKCFLLHLIASHGTICNIVSDAAYKPMTGSLAYNASKGAAYIMTLQLARELTRRHGICVFGVAPGKLKGTGMSQYIDSRVVEMRGWTPEQAEEYARAGRLWPEEIPPENLAHFLAHILESPDRHRYFSGCVIPYGA